MNQSPFRDLVWQGNCRKRLIMTRENQNRVEIDHVHAGAICAEIGERLQATLKPNTRMPPHLVRLTELLDSGDRRQRLQQFDRGRRKTFQTHGSLWRRFLASDRFRRPLKP